MCLYVLTLMGHTLGFLVDGFLSVNVKMWKIGKGIETNVVLAFFFAGCLCCYLHKISVLWLQSLQICPHFLVAKIRLFFECGGNL